MNSFLKRKGVHPSFQNYGITALSYMALGLFSTLIIGVIFDTVGTEIPHAPSFLNELGSQLMQPMIYGGAIGVSIAFGLKAPALVMFSSIFAGAFGAELGGPAGSFIAALFAIEIGKLVSEETKIDIIVTPLVTTMTGYFIAIFVGPYISNFLRGFGSIIIWATDLRPLLMGMIIAVLMGLALTAPISSAAIAIMLELEGIAAGAATVGCCAQMVGFAVSSYRENGISGLVSQGLGTSMLQVPNILKNPRILIPPTLTGLLLAPVVTIWLQLENNAYGAGMGTSGLVGPIMTIETMGFSLEILVTIILVYFIAPALISLILSELLRKIGWIRYGDMKLQTK